ncbi:MAG: acyl-CoA desaturase [Planctomycetota bacterium]|nr:MAG: acyl-CoA desaturase [Planctomycetota bacterium]
MFWILLIHAVSVVGLVLYPFPGWGVLAGAYALMMLGGLGTSVCYHRALAHRSLRLNRAVEFVMTALAIFNSSGAPATWTANHRLHHAKTDTDGDISSPRVGGFWWSHLRWLWQAVQSPVDRWAPDLNTPYYRFWNRWQVPILALSFFVGLPFGWPAFFWLGAIRLVVGLHGQAFVNSVAHMKKGVKMGEDSSRNIWWLGFYQSFLGENWHGNHHAKPASARLGWSWRQPDLGWYVIWTLEKLGLASKVRRPKLA